MIDWKSGYDIDRLSANGIYMKPTGKPIGSLFKVVSSRNEVFCVLSAEDCSEARLTPVGTLEGVKKSDFVVHVRDSPAFAFGEQSKGKVLDAVGHQYSTDPESRKSLPDKYLTLDPEPISPMSRGVINRIFETGVSGIDALLTLGVGQRVGLFAGTGVGKSMLMSMMAQYSTVDVIVIGLIGERGREVKEFVDYTMKGQDRDRFVIIASPADDHPSKRVQAAKAATAVAEHYRDQGKNVLLLIDSLTRYAQAIREVAIEEGDLPAARGYPVKAFYEIPRLVERAGMTTSGSITGIYTVLSESDEFNDPITDAARGVLDGHIVLSRELSQKSIYPAIDISKSVSRVMHNIVSKEHQKKASEVREMFAKYQEYREMEIMGNLDSKNREGRKVIDARPIIERFIKQSYDVRIGYKDSVDKIMGTSFE